MADEQYQASAKSHFQTRLDNVTQYQNVQRNFNKKIGVTRKLKEQVDVRVQSMAQAGRAVQRCLTELLETKHSLDGPRQLCSWRLEQRAMRPARELIRDNLEIALEEEHEALLKGQRLLQLKADQTEGLLSQLQSLHRELKSDGEYKAGSMSIDKQCVDTKHQTWPGTARVSLGLNHWTACEVPEVPQTAALPPLIATHSADGTHKTSMVHKANCEHEELMRQEDTLMRIRHARDLERDAEDYREQAEEVRRQVLASTKGALKRVQEEMRKRIAATQAMKKRVEFLVSETKARIGLLTQSMTRTGSQMQSHAEPLHLCAIRESIRSRRVKHEDIADPVASAMDEHKIHLKQNHDELEECRQNEVEMLQDLENMRHQLESDLRDKVEALSIDVRCQKHGCFGKDIQMSSFSSKTSGPLSGRSLKIKENPLVIHSGRVHESHPIMSLNAKK